MDVNDDDVASATRAFIDRANHHAFGDMAAVQMLVTHVREYHERRLAAKKSMGVFLLPQKAAEVVNRLTTEELKRYLTVSLHVLADREQEKDTDVP